VTELDSDWRDNNITNGATIKVTAERYPHPQSTPRLLAEFAMAQLRSAYESDNDRPFGKAEITTAKQSSTAAAITHVATLARDGQDMSPTRENLTAFKQGLESLVKLLANGKPANIVSISAEAVNYNPALKEKVPCSLSVFANTATGECFTVYVGAGKFSG